MGMCRHSPPCLSLLLLWPPTATFLSPPCPPPLPSGSTLTSTSPTSPTATLALLPSPWIARIVSFVLDPPPPSLEPSLDAFCRRFLLRLPPAFVFAALRHSDLCRCPISALRFFRWATCQKNYPSHNLNSCVSLIDALSSFSPTESNQIRELVTEIWDWAELCLTSLTAASSLIRML